MSHLHRRPLHWVFKVGNRNATINFYRDVLGMTVLRHEEFDEGCEATCNGPYNSKWSKTMIGYGHEDTNFVIELTYNYGIGGYKLGNDFRGISIESDDAINSIKKSGYKINSEKDGVINVSSPDGHNYFVTNSRDKGESDVTKVSVNVSNLDQSLNYWRNTLGMSVYDQKSSSAVLGFGRFDCKLEIVATGSEIIHDTAIGRIAFGCPRSDQVLIRDAVKAINGKILNDLVELPTPGKATVRVLILVDPDGYEICFVGDEEYRLLSQIDPKGNELLNKSMEADKSDEWFASKGLKKN